MLVWLRYCSGGLGLDDLYNSVYTTYKNGKLPADATFGVSLKSAGMLNLAGSVQIDKLLEDIQAAILAERSGLHEGDLIDMLIKQLRLPFPSSVLAGPVLENISKALIDPNQMRVLASELEKSECHCGACGHRFVGGEVSTTSIAGGRVTLLCTLCSPPQTVRCPTCGETILYELLLKRTNHSNCNFHKSSKRTSKLDKLLPKVAFDLEAAPPMDVEYIAKILDDDDDGV